MTTSVVGSPPGTPDLDRSAVPAADTPWTGSTEPEAPLPLYAADEAVLFARAVDFSCSYSLALMAPESSSAFADALSSVTLPLPPSGVATDRM